MEDTSMLENLKKALAIADRKAECIGKSLLKNPDDAETEAKYDRILRECCSLREKVRRVEMTEIIDCAREYLAHLSAA
jgi:hypothetical protein